MQIELAFLAHVLPPVLIGNDIKDQQVSCNSLAWFIMDNRPELRLQSDYLKYDLLILLECTHS